MYVDMHDTFNTLFLCCKHADHFHSNNAQR